MPIAAVPEYLGQDFKDASPGMRFGMYLPIWTARTDQEVQIRNMASANSREGRELARILETAGMDAAIAHAQQHRGRFPKLWYKNDHAARSVWGKVAALGRGDRDRIEALIERQATMKAALGGRVAVFEARSTAPFTTGLGNEHPLENGFSFLWPYGLPYLPGSGVKGVLRQAARELAGLIEEVQWEVESDWNADALTALFGSEDSDDAQRGALAFWDVIPRIEGDRLMVEIMTGHQTHYYMQGQSPHDSGQPIPVYFLTVPPGSSFTFHVACDRPFLRHLDSRLGTRLAEGDAWRRLIEQAFGHAFDWLGFGAKTAVGYGAMAVADGRGMAETDAETSEGSAFEESETVWDNATLIFDPGRQEISARQGNRKTAPLRGEAAERLKSQLSDDQRQRLKRKKSLTGVAVWVSCRGNLIELKGLA